MERQNINEKVLKQVNGGDIESYSFIIQNLIEQGLIPSDLGKKFLECKSRQDANLVLRMNENKLSEDASGTIRVAINIL